VDAAPIGYEFEDGASSSGRPAFDPIARESVDVVTDGVSSSGQPMEVDEGKKISVCFFNIVVVFCCMT
jgi:hypothetical protein